MASSTRCIVAGIMEHIEEAGVHSGNSACVLPSHTLPSHIIEKLRLKQRHWPKN